MNGRDLTIILMALAVLLMGCSPGLADSPSLEGHAVDTHRAEGGATAGGYGAIGRVLGGPDEQVHRV